MANRSLRRSPVGSKPTTLSTIVESGDDTDSVPGESIEQPTVDGNASEDDRNIDSEPSASERVGVVDVDPSKLGEFIADRERERTDNGDGRKRRTRSDSGTRRVYRKRKEAPQNVEAVATMIHTWASILLKTPELMLAPEEVKQLSSAYESFSEYHEVPGLTPKRMSEVNLIATACIIYLPRFIAIRNRKRDEKVSNVTPINNRGVVGH